MKTLTLTAALAASVLAPAAAQAQAIPAAVVAVVDLEKITATCNACKTASAALQAQVRSFQTRRDSLSKSLQTEQQAIQTAVDALKGAQPDAALQARAKAFQTKAQQDDQQHRIAMRQRRHHSLDVERANRGAIRGFGHWWLNGPAAASAAVGQAQSSGGSALRCSAPPARRS